MHPSSGHGGSSGHGDERPDHDPSQVRVNWAQRRRDRIYEEIQRNRRGEYTVPTWVLVAALALIVGIWAALLIFS